MAFIKLRSSQSKMHSECTGNNEDIKNKKQQDGNDPFNEVLAKPPRLPCPAGEAMLDEPDTARTRLGKNSLHSLQKICIQCRTTVKKQYGEQAMKLLGAASVYVPQTSPITMP